MRDTLVRLVRRDPEARTLRAIDRVRRTLPPRATPLDRLQVAADLARELTRARYSALAVTDEYDRTQGFVTSGLSRQELAGLRTPPQAHGPLGSLRADGRPVRIDDVRAHAKHFGFPTHHPEMMALLGVPLWSRGHVRGSLYVTDRTDGHPFDDDDEVVMLVIGRYASQVIEHDWY